MLIMKIAPHPKSNMPLPIRMVLVENPSKRYCSDNDIIYGSPDETIVTIVDKVPVSRNIENLDDLVEISSKLSSLFLDDKIKTYDPISLYNMVERVEALSEALMYGIDNEKLYFDHIMRLGNYSRYLKKIKGRKVSVVFINKELEVQTVNLPLILLEKVSDIIKDLNNKTARIVLEYPKATLVSHIKDPDNISIVDLADLLSRDPFYRYNGIGGSRQEGVYATPVDIKIFCVDNIDYEFEDYAFEILRLQAIMEKKVDLGSDTTEIKAKIKTYCDYMLYGECLGSEDFSNITNISKPIKLNEK